MSDAPADNPTPKIELKKDGTLYECRFEEGQHAITGYKRVKLEIKFDLGKYPPEWGLWITEGGGNSKKVRDLPQTDDLAKFSSAIEAKYGLQDIDWKERGSRGQVQDVFTVKN